MCAENELLYKICTEMQLVERPEHNNIKHWNMFNP